MNILVTGANGQLGSHLRLLGPSSQHNYLFTDVDELDITRSDVVMNYVLTNDIKVVVNCGAYTNVDRAETDESTAELINAVGVRNLAEAEKANRGTLVHISSDYVFGGANYNTPIVENAPFNPTGAYGRTKLHGEEAVYAVGCRHLVIRTAWMYSEFGNNFVKTMLRILPERECKVVFDQVGTPTYAGDLAEVIFNIIENDLYLAHEGVYHYSNEGVCSWYDFAVEIARQAGIDNCHIKPCHSNEFPSNVIRPPFSVLDKTKIKNTFGITIPHWTESLGVMLSKMK